MAASFLRGARFSPHLLFRGHSNDVRVRFAPSPTGELHLGGLRTALYNFLFARSRGGAFIVRVEDTDQTRIVPGSVDRIHSLLSRYDLFSDEDPWRGGPLGPYTQSERLPLYAEHARLLVYAGAAYRCFCSPKRLELLRKDAARTGAVPMYDRKCRSIPEEESERRARDGEEHVIRFKLDHQEVHFEDTVFGPVTQRLEESDLVLLKSDGFPTYHLACIVDDHLMEISHVIRGMEWLSSTGKHVLLYKAFNWQPPTFAHLPLMTRNGKQKLSKRDKDAFASFYDQELGVLPQAVLNVLVRNGSGIRDYNPAHLYSLEELMRDFSLDEIGRRNLQLDSDVLAHFAAEAFRAAPIDEVLIPLIRDRLASDMPGAVSADPAFLRRVVAFLRENEEQFGSLADLTRGRFSFFFSRPATPDHLLHAFPGSVAWAAIDAVLQGNSLCLDKLKGVATKLAMPYPKLLSILRWSLIDSKSGPPISELVEFFGEKECMQRLAHMQELLKERNTATRAVSQR